MEPAPCAKNSGALGVGAGELDGGFDGFAAGTAEEIVVDAALGEPAKSLGSLPASSGTWACSMAGPRSSSSSFSAATMRGGCAPHYGRSSRS